MKQTAVEWLEDFMNNGKQKSEGIISLAFATAKAMEKEQIIESFYQGVEQESSPHGHTYLGIEEAEQYYNETFKSE